MRHVSRGRVRHRLAAATFEQFTLLFDPATTTHPVHLRVGWDQSAVGGANSRSPAAERGPETEPVGRVSGG